MKNKSDKKFELNYHNLSNKQKFKRISCICLIFGLISLYNLVTSTGSIGIVANIFAIIFIILILVGSYYYINRNK